jgi:hypothetical protein
MTTASHRSWRTVAEYDTYAEAQRAVDHLSDEGFPVDRVAIAGDGMHYVERIGGRMTVGRAALQGALHGAMLGALFGLFAWLLFALDPDPVLPLLVLYGIVVGALLGALLGALMHAATGGERDFTSAAGLEAERYRIVVGEGVADRAAELLRTLGTRVA